MTFTPAIPFGGLLGWKVFERSADVQFEAHSTSAGISREVEYFRENIGEATTSEALIGDSRLLMFAMTAFGLEEEFYKKAIVRRALDEGTDDSASFANNLSDSKWAEFSDAFGYGNIITADVTDPTWQEAVVDKFLEHSFEVGVGGVDENMRLAMNFRREVETIAARDNVDTVGWFNIMGSAPLRAVVEKAFGLPGEFGSIDIDKQKVMLEERAYRMYGDTSPSVFLDSENVDDVLRRFFLQVDIESGPSASTPGMAAVTLMTNAVTSASSINLFLSNT